MTPLQEQITRVSVSCVMAVIVIFICGFIVLEIKMMSDGDTTELFGDSMVSICKECHENLNATENITSCNICRKIWSETHT